MNSRQGALHDLNDLRFFAAVVEHHGFSAAGRALDVPKSRLSKRIAQLEERLGVRLLQRTTRRFAVTEIGERFYAHCRAALEEAQAAQDVVDELRAEPRGIVRVSCPVSLAQTIVAHVLPDFLLAYPKVQVRVLATNRRVDVIGEGFDLAIRVRSKLDTDTTLVLRSFGLSRVLLVASPAFLDRHGRPLQPADLEPMPLLSMLEHDGAHVVELTDAGGHGAHVDPAAAAGRGAGWRSRACFAIFGRIQDPERGPAGQATGLCHLFYCCYRAGWHAEVLARCLQARLRDIQSGGLGALCGAR